MAELLLELFSEEIPARMQPRAAADLRRLVTERLTGENLRFSRAEAFATPRRLALIVEGLPLAQDDVTEEKKGPRVGAPDKAVEGFLRSAGLDSLDQCEKRDTGKGEFWFAVQTRRGRHTDVVLRDLLPAALADLPWPKSMRWGAHPLRWVRPLHAILCLFDGAVVPFAFGHLEAQGATTGHRFMGRERLVVNGVADYKARLRAAKVMLDPEERAAAIMSGIDRLARVEGLRVAPDDGLLQEVVGLVEWPTPLLGRIDEEFMSVPREVLTTSMRSNQKYFTLERADGTMAPRFAVVANMLADDGGAAIVAGNEKVLRARLSDARFFWEQDRKARLDSRLPALAGIVFHAKLGAMADKVERVRALAAKVAAMTPGAEPAWVDRAALLAKADLVTGMVGEFPELQGVMGRYYALHDSEAGPVADAIAEHYAPLGPSDRAPTAPVSVCVALADKLDTLIGFFAIGETPTGSRDPFGLRRAALGVIRIALENGLRLPLRQLGVGDELLAFFADRLKVYLRDRGLRHDVVAAVFAKGDDDLVRIVARAEALQAFIGADDGANLLVAYRRAANILRAEEKKDGRAYAAPVDPAQLLAAEERVLAARLAEVAAESEPLIAAEDYGRACSLLARLRQPVDAFFTAVTVNAPEPALRENRLNLLAGIKRELDRIADLSQLEG